MNSVSVYAQNSPARQLSESSHWPSRVSPALPWQPASRTAEVRAVLRHQAPKCLRLLEVRYTN